MRRIRLTACLLCAQFLQPLTLTPLASADEPKETAEGQAVFFETQILPILKRRCYECHSHESGKAKGGLVLDSRQGWQKGGSSGTAIIAGKVEESLLIEAVRYDGLEMPPDEQLPRNEIALLEKWVSTGAHDPRKSVRPAIDPKKLWALQPIQSPTIPEVVNRSWPTGDIDAFVLARLEKEGLGPRTAADRYTLLRRLTFDLTGLPPTPQEIEAFVNDSSPEAYEKVVDRLLDSPAFGDHWARHWFDLSCYADLADIDGNVLIRDAWRYRDYVIAAFNSDKPLDLFIHEQIAGDLLPYDSIDQRREQIIATGYLAIGPWTLQNYIKGQLAADVVDHQIDRIGRTFLGQTISCARCHDHKFDPVPTKDYYALAGIFHSTLTTSYDGPGVWSQITHVTLPSPAVSRQEIDRRDTLIEELTARRSKVQSELTSLVLKIPGGSTANVLTLQKAVAANEREQPYDVSFQAAPSVWAAAAQGTTANDGLQIDILKSDGSVLASHRHDPGAWSTTKDAQQMKPARFSYIGDGSGDLRIRITSATPGSGRFGGAIDDLVIRSENASVFSAKFDDLKIGPIVGTQAHTSLKIFAQASVPGWDGDGINHSHAVELEDGNYAVQFFGGDSNTLSATKPVTPAQELAKTQALKLELQVQQLSTRIAKLRQIDAPESALAVRDVDVPADSPIYKRGSFQSLGEIVPRGFLGAVPVANNYEIPEKTSGRRQLAQWLTDQSNPLTPRVLVNRVWHHLFGQALVRTVDYFGVHGETPSHPELLDFLALQLRETDDWSLKKTVRRMVLSRTYQMASSHDARAFELDPNNRLLWRMPRRRLAAESIRDAILAASGELSHERGGPSLGLELKGNIRGAGGEVNPASWGSQIADYIKNRRSVYLPYKRARPSGELEILSVFNFPHPSEITGSRPNTTVATQALFLMNSPFVKHQSQKLAARVAREEPGARIQQLYLLTVGRPADVDEIHVARNFLDQCTEDLIAEKRDKETARAAAWAQLCHAVLASNNFLFRE